MKHLPQRKSPRLKGYDYSQSGAYFITICTHRHQHLFGKIIEDAMILNPSGNIAYECWQAIPEHYPDIELDVCIVMPNHLHGIICIVETGSNFKTYLGRVINAYKGAVTARIRKLTSPDKIVWQGRYFDNIIRTEKSLNMIRQYTIFNAAKWAEDRFYSVEE